NINSLRRKNKFNKIMDCIAEIAVYFDRDIDEFNELLEDNSIGFQLYNDPHGTVWEVMDGVTNYSEEIEEALDVVANKHVNVIEHLIQARKQLLEINNHRARKDALRDAISALEAQLKYITGE